ncbi:MAG TPA: GAF domain-containing sensor histidine kinase [Chloroflexota bacterium]|nr:GAF domain-containing sensor histidine kinase [Chloroflexota bacterium]
MSEALDRGGRTSDLATLSAVAEALNSAPDVESALTRTLALVAQRFGLQTGWVWLLDPESEQFYIAAVYNLPPFLQQPVQMTGESCSCIWEFRRGSLTPRNIDVMECSRLRRALRSNLASETAGLRYHASIPLTAGERSLGIMNLTGPSWRKLTLRELRLLSTVAYQVGGAVERERLAAEGTRLARAEERTRLAREIHDTLAQDLTAIALHLEGALRHLDSSPQRARERLERALSTTRESLVEARRSVLNLRASPLAGKPLEEALGALARTFTAETGIRARVTVSGQRALRALPLRTEAELFRIAQEALTNVRKHAQARTVDITLRARGGTRARGGGGTRARGGATRGVGGEGEGGRVVLSIRDDGQGLPPARRRALLSRGGPEGPGGIAGRDSGGSGHGILGMRERARLLGGALRLTSPPGTTVSVSAPFDPEDRSGAAPAPPAPTPSGGRRSPAPA